MSGVCNEVSPTVSKHSKKSSAATDGAVARSPVNTEVTLTVGELSISSVATD